MCYAILLLVLLALGWLLADQLDTVVLAVQAGNEIMVIAKGWEIVSTLWMLPVIGFVLALFVVMVFNRIAGSRGAGCCGAQGCEVPETPEKSTQPPEK